MDAGDHRALLHRFAADEVHLLDDAGDVGGDDLAIARIDVEVAARLVRIRQEQQQQQADDRRGADVDRGPAARRLDLLGLAAFGRHGALAPAIELHRALVGRRDPAEALRGPHQQIAAEHECHDDRRAADMQLGDELGDDDDDDRHHHERVQEIRQRVGHEHAALGLARRAAAQLGHERLVRLGAQVRLVHEGREQVIAVALDQRVAALEQDVDAAEEGDRQPGARQGGEGVAGVVPDEHADAEQEHAHQQRPGVQPDALAPAQLVGVADPHREAREEAEAKADAQRTDAGAKRLGDEGLRQHRQDVDHQAGW